MKLCKNFPSRSPGDAEHRAPVPRPAVAEASEAPDGSVVAAPGPSSLGGPAAAEFFSGSGGLSKALEKVGIRCQEYDLKLNVSHDMSDMARARELLAECVRREVRYVHFAPPCNSFSMARFPKLRLESFKHDLQFSSKCESHDPFPIS